jgi:hypothetical protein
MGSLFSRRMVLLSLFSFSLIFIFLLISSSGCKDSITDPPEDKPAGYQEDIPWPSMDKNPWPIHNGNAQLNNRSRFSGPTQGIVEWQIEIPAREINDDSYRSPVCDDSTIYIVTFWDEDSSSTHLRAIGFDGIPRWKIPLESNMNSGKVTTEPVLSSDGTIYVADWANKVLAVRTNGTIKWTLNVAPANVNSQMNLDKEGNLYCFANDGVLYKVSPSGEVKWTLKLSSFGSSGSAVVFAPDGKTMYVTGYELYAVSTEGELKWSYDYPYDNNTWGYIPLVNASGNIYIKGAWLIKPDGHEGPNYTAPDSIRSYTPNGDIEPVIDKNGNIYTGAVGLASFDYKGNLRWAKNIALRSYFSLGCDKDNNIYYLTLDNKLTCIDSNGTEKWQLQLDGRYYYSAPIVNGRMYLCTVRGTKRYLYSVK